MGSYLLKTLIRNGYRVYALARSKDNKSAEDRVIDILKFWDRSIATSGLLKNLKIIEGDIAYPGLGIKLKKDTETIISDAEVFFHSAALTDVTAPLELIRKINVEGTRNILDFALECKRRGRLSKVNHISTAYVAGAKKNIEFSEDMLELGQDFNNTYEQSKYEAELLVKQYLNRGLNISIFRSGMIIGDSKEGRTTDFRLFYTALRFFSRGLFSEFPANPICEQNFINIDTVINAILLLAQKPQSKVYHIVSGRGSPVGLFIKLAGDYFGFELPKFIPIEKFNFKKLTPAQAALAGPYVPYFNYTVKFISDQTQKALKEYNFSYPEIDEENIIRNLFYCEKTGFIKKKNDMVLKNA